jgi:putative FmdB family regulatory protein
VPRRIGWEGENMPIYEFRCPSCGHQFEELVLGRFDISQVHCPKCLKHGVERLLSVFSGCGVSERASQGASGTGCSSSSRFS